MPSHTSARGPTDISHCLSRACRAARGTLGSIEGYAQVGDQLLVVGVTQWTMDQVDQAIPALKRASLLTQTIFR